MDLGGNQLQSDYASLCLSASSSSATGTLRLYTCDSADTKQHWQYNNTVITSEYYPSYALTDSPRDTYVGLYLYGKNWFQYWEDGTNMAPVSPNVISLENHVSGECLDVYVSTYYYIRATTCDGSSSTQQWAWFGNHLQSMEYGLCLPVSSSSATDTIKLADCNPTDSKQYWSYNNTVITSVYYSDYALTDSPISTYVGLSLYGRNYFQYWKDGTNTSPVSPDIISLQNHFTEECLYAYSSVGYYVRTTTCDVTSLTQQWAWFDNHLQSIDNALCLEVSSSSATGTLRLYSCDPADIKQSWQSNNSVINSWYYSDYCFTDSSSTYAHNAYCEVNNDQQLWYEAKDGKWLTYSPTANPTVTPTVEPTIDPTTNPTMNPTIKLPTVDPTANPTITPTELSTDTAAHMEISTVVLIIGVIAAINEFV